MTHPPPDYVLPEVEPEPHHDASDRVMLAWVIIASFSFTVAGALMLELLHCKGIVP